MAIQFPSSPANNEHFTSNGRTWRWNGTRWVSSGSYISQTNISALEHNVVPAANVTYDLGTSDKRFRDLYLSGNTLHLGTTSLSVDADGALQTTTANGQSVAIGGGVVVYANTALLPTAQDSTTGDMAYVEENTGVYLFTGSVWNKIMTAATPNGSPAITTQPNFSYVLASNGEPTIVTLAGQDPEGTTLNWNYTVTGGTLGNTATITSNGNIFTITPSTNTNDEGSFKLTFTASDGLNISNSRQTLVTLKFSYDFANTTIHANTYPTNLTTSYIFGAPHWWADHYTIAQNIAYLNDTLVASTYDIYGIAPGTKVFDTSDSHNGNWSEVQTIAGRVNTVDLKNDILVLGNHEYNSNKGRVTVYQKQSNGIFTSLHTLDPNRLETSSGGEWQIGDDHQYGSSVALSQDAGTLVVGARTAKKDNITTQSGGIEILKWNATNSQFENHQDFHSQNISTTHNFYGHSVAISPDGNRIAVGDFSHINDADSRGAIRIYDNIPNGSTYVQRQVIQFLYGAQENNNTYGQFGSNVKMTENFLATTAPNWSWHDAYWNYNMRGLGKLYLYKLNPVTNEYEEIFTKTPQDGLFNNYNFNNFPRVIAMNETADECTVVWGIPSPGTAPNNNNGTVRISIYDKNTDTIRGLNSSSSLNYYFNENGGGANDEITFSPAEGGYYDQFGSSGAIDPTTGKLAVSAPRYAQNGFSQGGTIRIFQAG